MKRRNRKTKAESSRLRSGAMAVGGSPVTDEATQIWMEVRKMVLAMADYEYISCTATAKLVRKALKRAFPHVKFSVRSDSYSMGASIRVSWDDGPRAAKVSKVTGMFEGKSFDGMIDMGVSHMHYMTEDGEIGYAGTGGTEDNAGTIPAVVNEVPAGAKMVRLGADYVFPNRTVSDYDTKLAEALAYIRENCHTEGEGSSERFANDWVADIAARMVFDRDESEKIEAAFRRIVLRWSK